ncbi:hypothetical protein [Deinococcus aestuarii]|uniref:hypothetical protein n=1 Tax=Deinococcus aestuarii TaxID=2774531 RepID=UPI001C0AFF65|nr:hypothetical protein [Deinococcus aestuarii]
MASVAELWLVDDLAEMDDLPLPRLQADLYRFTRQTGWGLYPFTASPSDGLMQALTFQAPHQGPSVEMRVHRVVPVLGFVDADALRESMDEWASSWVAWGHGYINPQPLAGWWQANGWITPDAAWLNARPTPENLQELSLREGPEWRRWRQLSRGDALFFEW